MGFNLDRGSALVCPFSFTDFFAIRQATVMVNGVSDTNSRLQFWHPDAWMAFTLLPCTMVTDVGAVADANGMVKSCDTFC